MAGPENMDEPRPGAAGGEGVPPGGNKPPETGAPAPSPEGENPINPQDALAIAIAQLFQNPVLIDSIGQSLARGAKQESLAEQLQAKNEAERLQRKAEAVRKIEIIQQTATYIYNLEQTQAVRPLSENEQNILHQAKEARNAELQKASFEEFLFFAENFQNPAPDQKMNLDEAIRSRDRLLTEAKEKGLFDESIAQLSGIYYGSRVMITNDHKEGRGEQYEGHGKIQELENRRRLADKQEAELIDPRTGEKIRSEFWSDPEHPERKDLEIKYRGVVNYFNQKSLDLIMAVVKDRKIYTPQHRIKQPPPDGIYKLWDGFVIDNAGHVLVEDGEPKKARDFDDFREAIEEARRREPWVPNRSGDWETTIRYVADDIEELEEMIPYIVAKVRKKLGTGQPDRLSQKLESEKEKHDGALAVFPERLIKSERQFRRLKSTLAANLNLMGAYYFSEKVRDDWGPYLSYMGLLATGTQDTEIQDHLVDALFLDRDGLTMLALEKYMDADGIFWRYGQNSADLDKKIENENVEDMGDLFAWQESRREDIERFLMGKKMKDMQVLLDTHPAFIRLKQKYDAQDAKDMNKYHHIRDARGKETHKTRWQEYCEKALKWKETGEFGDPRKRERVTFQHPLARTFKAPIRNAKGEIQSYELFDMFETDTQINTDRWHESAKRRKVKSTMEKAERISRAFMQDSVAALAWHTFKGKKDDGSLDPVKSAEQVALVNQFLTKAGLKEITAAEAVPHKTLYRAFMKTCLDRDKTKSPKDKRFKMYYLLTEKLGLDLDLPTFAAWNLGAHDTGRPTFLLPAVRKDKNDPNGLASVMPAPGMDEKNTGVKWEEDERRMGLLVEIVLKEMFPDYFNFPGHDTPGAGVKDIRNTIDPIYGISKGTVWISDLIKASVLGSRDPLKDQGFSRSFAQYVGAYKGGDEEGFRQSGYAGYIESPRDLESWVKRTNTIVEQYKSMQNGSKEGPGILKDAPFSGMFLWRDFSHGGLGRGGKYMSDHSNEKLFAINKADEAIKDMTEATYRSGLELAGRTAAPLAAFMKHTIESTFGRNPESAKFLNTLLWYAVSKWMDTSWEFREKPGFAVDGNLHLARYFIHQYLIEDSGLIYSDAEWDQIMLGYTKVKKDGISLNVPRYQTKIDGADEIITILEDISVNGKVVLKQGEKIRGKQTDVHEGLIDSFPEEVRKKILEGEKMVMLEDGKLKKEEEAIAGGDKFKIFNGKPVRITNYWLPFGLKSKYPETFVNYYRDTDAVKEDYKGALNQIRGRKEVIRL